MKDENSGLIPITDHELFQATTMRGFEPGQTIFHRFVLTRVLGRGGMGIVWLAHDTQLEQEVAIKVLPDVVMHDREAVGDMKRETKRSLQLNHHNIVRIYDFNQDETVAGISMEFVDGQTLSAAKAERPHGCFDVEDVAPWLEQICDALAYAHHKAKIVHRDLKPANIMLSKDSVIKVTDFGIARSISDSISRVSVRHASSGTMVYMSPQQSTGARSSSADDIYSLGATLYDLLTGKPPFFSGNIQHQLENITPPSMTERRQELERHGNPIPETWERAVAACLQKEASFRPASVMDLAQRLGLRVAAGHTTYSTGIATPPLPQPAGYDRTVVDYAAPPSTHPSVAYPPQPATQYALQPSTPHPSQQPAFAPPPGAPPTSTIPYVPPTPPPPREPFFTPARLKLASYLGGGLLALALIAGLISFLSRGHGTVIVATDPPGATVTIDGKTMPSPATFDTIPAGDETVNISLQGYDPVQLPAQVVKDQTLTLPMASLSRSTGLLAVTVIPPQASCTLRFVQSDVAGEPTGVAVASFPGAQPWQSKPLPTGKYEIVTSAADFQDGHDEVDLQRGDTKQIVVDLIKEDAARSLTPEQLAAVNADSLPDSMTGDAGQKAQLIAYYRKAFDGYMQANEFDLAQSQVKHLGSDLGVDTADLQQQIDDGRQIAIHGQGTVSVKTDPEGAAVTLKGRTLPSPAVFDRVLAGANTAEIKMAGYDPVTVPAQVNRDMTTDLGTITLNRWTGGIQITTIPRRADGALRLVRSDAPDEDAHTIDEFSGPEPYKTNTLGSGSYEITANSDGFPTVTKNIDIRKGDRLQVTVDLVKENGEHQLNPAQVAVVDADQPIPDAMKQDPAAKAALTTYYQQVFNDYLKLKEFKLAESALHHLSGDLGVQSAQNQAMLDQLQTEWLTSEKTNLTQLIQQEKFDDAEALLADMEAHGPQPDLRAQLNQAKTAHEATVTAALANINGLEAAGNEQGAYEAALAASNQDKLEPRLALRVMTIELSMPSTYDRVSGRIKAMNDMLDAEPSMAQNADFVRMQGIFQRNLDKHNDFRAQIAQLKKAVYAYDDRIDDLRAEQKHDQAKENGYKTLNVFGLGSLFGGLAGNNAPAAGAGAGAAAVGANGAAARDADVRRLQGEIEQLQGEQSQQQAQLDQVKQQYDQFQQSPINAMQ